MSHFFRFATANNSALRSVFTSENAAAIRDVPQDGWFEIAPYGEHAAPDGSYVQVFGREQAERLVKTWNSITGKFSRRIFNARWTTNAPVWEGHPDVDPERWPTKLQLAEITELRATETGLEGYTVWNTANMAKRGAGPLKPSAFWVHDAPDADGRVFPELLLSVGLVPTPNIKTTRQWTRNSSTNPNDNTDMKQTEIALALGLKAEATWDEIKAAIQGATANAAALVTANANHSTATTQLATANAQIGTLTTERDTLRTQVGTLTTANGTLTTERDTLRTERDAIKTTANALGAALAELGEKAGRVTPAERDNWKAKLSLATANATPASVEAAAKELAAKAPEFNTQPLGSLTTPAVLATANAAADQMEAKVHELMKSGGISYADAWDRCMEDTANAALVKAMNEAPK